MKQYVILAGLILMTACKPGKKENTEGDIKKDSNTVVQTNTDTNTVLLKGPIDKPGKVDIESFGPIRLGQPYSEFLKILGPPDAKSKAIEWGADGLLHEDWTWKSKGLVLNLSADKNNKDSTLSIFTITATAPCDFKTKANMGMGSSYAEVETAYKKDIDPEATDKTQITVGSVYGGIIFSFRNDKVSRIFLGAEAE